MLLPQQSRAAAYATASRVQNMSFAMKFRIAKEFEIYGWRVFLAQNTKAFRRNVSPMSPGNAVVWRRSGSRRTEVWAVCSTGRWRGEVSVYVSGNQSGKFVPWPFWSIGRSTYLTCSVRDDDDPED